MMIQNYNPNMVEIAEEILLGPQAEVLTDINNLNDRYGTTLRSTKTFRWSPGTGELIKQAYLKHILTWEKKYSGVYYFFNRIDDRRWHHNNFRDSLNRIDRKMTTLRNDGIRFQDNTDIVVEAFTTLKNKAIEELETIDNMYSNQDVSCRLEVIDDQDYSNCKFRFWILFSNPIMSVFNDNAVLADIKLYPTELYYDINMVNLVNAQSANINNRNRHFSTMYGRYLSPSDTIYHPYLNRHHYRGTDQTEDRQVCLGSMQGDITGALNNFNFIAATELLCQWITRYHVNHTHPHNKPNKSYYGLPKYIEDQPNSNLYLAAIPHDPIHCGVPTAIGLIDTDEGKEYAIINDTTCNDIKCALRDSCKYYQNVIMLPEERLDNILASSTPTDFPYVRAYQQHTLDDVEIRDAVDFTLGNDFLTEDLEDDIEMTAEERAMIWVEQQIERRNNE